jgi:hypothetical protein
MTILSVAQIVVGLVLFVAAIVNLPEAKNWLEQWALPFVGPITVLAGAVQLFELNRPAKPHD